MKRFLSLTLIFSAILLVCSCSNERRSAAILEAIPAEATSVRFVNIPLAIRSGVDITDYAALSICRGIDVMALTTFPDGSRMFLSEAPASDSIAASDLSPVDIPETLYSAYSSADGYTMIINAEKSIAFITTLPAIRALEEVKQIEKDAAEASMTSFKGVANFIEEASGNSPIYGVVARKTFNNYLPADKEPQAEQWLTFSASADESETALNVSLIEGSGKPVEIKGLRTINTDFLRYTPSSVNMACAVGLTPEMDWDVIFNMFSIFPTGELGSYLAMALPYLKDIDGTVAIALAADGNMTSVPAAFIMAPISTDKIRQLMDQVKTLASMTGLDVTGNSGESISVVIPGFGSVYVNDLDGNLAISTFPLEAGQSNELTPVFQGHDAAAVINLPAGTSIFGFNGPRSDVSVEMAVDSNEATLRARHGADVSVFPYLFSAMIR